MTQNSKSHSDEYKALRDEILFLLRSRIQFQMLLVVAPAALLGTALSLPEPDPLLYLAPALIALPVVVRHSSLTKLMTRNDTYLMVFHDVAGNGSTWETRLAELEGKGRQSWSSLLAQGFLSFPMVLAGIYLLVCLFLYRDYWPGSGPLQSMAPLIVLFFYLLCGVHAVNAVRSFGGLLRDWKQVAEKEQRDPSGEGASLMAASIGEGGMCEGANSISESGSQ